MFDSHLHIGQFRDIYTSPQQLVDYLDSVGVGGFAVSSTTICERDYEKVLSEMKEISRVGGKRVLPILWVLPEMLEEGIIDSFIESGINWRILKIHPQLSGVGCWYKTSHFSRQLISLARKMNLPVLIHTGEVDGCYPMQYYEIVRDNPDIVFILAHGRPLNQAISIINSFQNAWCDTAFMPITDIISLCDAGLADRVLWGTDYPITQYYYSNRDMVEYYRSNLQALKNSTSEEDFNKITGLNALKLFGC